MRSVERGARRVKRGLCVLFLCALCASAARSQDLDPRIHEAEAKRLVDEAKSAEGVVQVRMAEAERQFQAYLGGFRALLERQMAELRALDGQRG